MARTKLSLSNVSSSNLHESVLSKTFSHFQTFVWLRWRIRVNQLRHGSALGKALAAILLASFAIGCIALIVAGGVLGVVVPRLIPRENYFLLWDGIIALFSFIWVVHVATDIQRSDAVTFDRILHLPVAFSQAFALNYLSSLMSMTLVSLCSFCFGFILGSCFSVGPVAILIAVPFVVFLVALTALTYQLQGWLAALMSNPRRRQMIMIFAPLCVIALSQLPAIFATRLAKNERVRTPVPASPVPAHEASPPTLPRLEDDSQAKLAVEPPSNVDAEVEQKMGTHGGDHRATLVPAEPAPPLELILDDAKRVSENNVSENKERQEQQEIARTKRRSLWLARLRLANICFPPLWMAGCVESVMSGNFHVIWLTGAMALVGFVSLRRNYKQTVRFYKGETDSRAMQTRGANGAVVKIAEPNGTQSERVAKAGVKKPRLVERDVPFVSDETAAIIMMTLQSMTRAPEVKLYLLLPLLAPFILFGFLQAMELPKIDELKAAIVVGFSGCSLFITSGMLGNLFAYDRAGFRGFVLSPIRRERILLGRNLATAPLLLLQTFLLALAIGIFFGMAIDKLLCSIILSASILPLYGLLTNLMSILTPFPLAAGSIQPKQFNLVPILFSLVLSMFMPAITLFALLPLGLEWTLDRYFPIAAMVPFAFLLSIPWLAASLFLYRWLLPWEGKLLANREKELLRIVTSKCE